MAKAKKTFHKAASQRGVPTKTKAQRLGGAKVHKKILHQTVASVENGIPSLGGAGTKRVDGFPPSFPFWPVSPFAIMRMWWGH